MPRREERVRRVVARAGAGARRQRRTGDAGRELDLLLAAQRGDRGARERLVVSHLDLVRSIASRYRHFGLAMDDLVQEGSIGLLQAVDRYDPERGAEFEAFARFRVRKAICDALTDQARLIRLPKQVVARRRAIDVAEAELAAAAGRLPTAAEIAVATGLSAASVLEARAASITPISLDALSPLEGARLERLLADTEPNDPEAELLDGERTRLLQQALRHLPKLRQREIVSRHYGLEGGAEAIGVVAGDLALSERRARTIEQDALRNLAAELLPALRGPG